MVQHNSIDHTGITGIGTGDVATDAIWDAKGDLAGGTGADTAAKLTAGANNTVLTADSAQATGMKWAAPDGKLLAVKYNVTGGSLSTTAATQADVDATNAAITFTAPASGNILVRVTLSCQINNANQNAFLGLREGTTDLVNSSQGTFIMQGQTATAQELNLPWTAYLTGVGAGAHTYKLSFSVNGGATFFVRQAAASPMTLEVWAAP